MFSGLIKGESIRHVKNTNNDKDRQAILNQFSNKLINRGYSKSEIDTSMLSISSRERSNLLQKKDNKCTEIQLIMGSRFNPRLKKIKKSISKYWNVLEFDETCKMLFKQQPIIAYKKHKNLSELLTSARLK